MPGDHHNDHPTLQVMRNLTAYMKHVINNPTNQWNTLRNPLQTFFTNAPALIPKSVSVYAKYDELNWKKLFLNILNAIVAQFISTAAAALNKHTLDAIDGFLFSIVLCLFHWTLVLIPRYNFTLWNITLLYGYFLCSQCITPLAIHPKCYELYTSVYLSTMSKKQLGDLLKANRDKRRHLKPVYYYWEDIDELSFFKMRFFKFDPSFFFKFYPYIENTVAIECYSRF